MSEKQYNNGIKQINIILIIYYIYINLESFIMYQIILYTFITNLV